VSHNKTPRYRELWSKILLRKVRASAEKTIIISWEFAQKFSRVDRPIKNADPKTDGQVDPEFICFR